MAQITNYKYQAFFYDLYCKCNSGDEFSMNELVQYHKISKMAAAYVKNNQYAVKTGKTYIWKTTKNISEIIEGCILYVRQYNNDYKANNSNALKSKDENQNDLENRVLAILEKFFNK